MDWWQITLIVLVGAGAILGGKPAWKRIWGSILKKASRGMKELSEAFMAQALTGQAMAEVMEKLAEDPSSVSKEELLKVWDSVQEVGMQWADVIEWAKDIFYSFHKR